MLKPGAPAPTGQPVGGFRRRTSELAHVLAKAASEIASTYGGHGQQIVDFIIEIEEFAEAFDLFAEICRLLETAQGLSRWHFGFGL